jgi:hypothetical protein
MQEELTNIRCPCLLMSLFEQAVLLGQLALACLNARASPTQSTMQNLPMHDLTTIVTVQTKYITQPHKHLHKKTNGTTSGSARELLVHQT